MTRSSAKRPSGDHALAQLDSQSLKLSPATTTSDTHPLDFPRELLNAIFDEFSDDPATLHALRLVCHTLQPSASAVLFRRISLRIGSTSRFLALLEGRPEIKSYVHSMSIYVPIGDIMNHVDSVGGPIMPFSTREGGGIRAMEEMDTARLTDLMQRVRGGNAQPGKDKVFVRMGLPDLLEMLPNLQTLEVSGAAGSPFAPRTALYTWFDKGLLRVGFSSRMSSLTLEGCTFTTYSKLACAILPFTRLSELVLQNICVEDDVLQIMESSLPAAVEWFKQHRHDWLLPLPSLTIIAPVSFPTIMQWMIRHLRLDALRHLTIKGLTLPDLCVVQHILRVVADAGAGARASWEGLQTLRLLPQLYLENARARREAAAYLDLSRMTALRTLEYDVAPPPFSMSEWREVEAQRGPLSVSSMAENIFPRNNALRWSLLKLIPKVVRTLVAKHLRRIVFRIYGGTEVNGFPYKEVDEVIAQLAKGGVRPEVVFRLPDTSSPKSKKEESEDSAEMVKEFVKTDMPFCDEEGLVTIDASPQRAGEYWTSLFAP